MAGSNTSGRGTNRSSRALRLLAGVAALSLLLAVPALASAHGSGFQWKGKAFMPITKTQGAEFSGKLLVFDTDAGGEIPMGVECTVNATVNVSTNGTGEVTAVTASSCVGKTWCESAKPSSLTAVNLPWHTELAIVEGTPREKLSSGGSGAPGFKMKCKVLGLASEDTCTGNVSPSLTGLEPGSFKFNKPEALTCSNNGKATGYEEGSETMSGVTGIEEGTPIWNGSFGTIESEKSVKWSKGSLTLIDQPNGPNGAPWGVTCEESGEGTVGALGTGSTTHITPSGCKQSGFSECNGIDSIEALHLPWKTQLYLGSKEAFADAFAEGGSGKVAFKIKCETHGLKEEDTCEAASGTANRLGAALTNGIESGVRSNYYGLSEGVSLTCGRGGSENSELNESSHVVKLSSGETLTVSG